MMVKIKKRTGQAIRCVFFLTTTVFVTACTSNDSTSKTTRCIPVKVQDAGGAASQNIREYVGTAEGTDATALSFSVSGTVEKVYVTAGQNVRKGQLLASLNSESMQNALQLTMASYKQAKDAYDRLKDLHAKGSIPDIKFVEVETGLEKAEASVGISRKNLKDTRLYSPAAGVIAECSLSEGQNAMPGLSAFKLVSIQKVNILASVPENEIGEIRVGQRASVRISALKNAEFEGKVAIKGVEANPVSHTYEVKIAVDNVHGSILPGMVSKVSILPSDHHKVESIVVPNKVVQISSDNTHFVWLAEKGVARRRFVTVGPLSDYGVVVTEGLQAGDQIIVEGASKVSEGMQVSIVK